jgi:hypothetical protein
MGNEEQIISRMTSCTLKGALRWGLRAENGLLDVIKTSEMASWGSLDVVKRLEMACLLAYRLNNRSSEMASRK